MKFSWSFFLLLPLLSGAQMVNYAQQKGFVINGKVSGAGDKTKVFLTDANNPSDTISKGIVKGEQFSLAGKLKEPGIYTIGIAGSAKIATIFLDNSRLAVTGNLSGPEKYSVSGSKLQQDFEEFQTIFNPLFQRLNQLNQQAQTQGATTALNDQSVKVVNDIRTEVEKFSTKTNSHVTPLLLVATAQLFDDASLLDKRFSSLSPDVKKGYYGRYLNSTLETMRVGAIGTPAINFTQNDTEGKPVSLAQFKGKYVLIDFWASWCGPCRQENPNVVNTFREFKDKNFTVLGISLDRNRDAWVNAIKADGLTWTHISDLKYFDNEVARLYKIQSIPQNYLVDPKGIIIAKNLRGERLRQRVSELVK